MSSFRSHKLQQLTASIHYTKANVYYVEIMTFTEGPELQDWYIYQYLIRAVDDVVLLFCLLAVFTYKIKGF